VPQARSCRRDCRDPMSPGGLQIIIALLLILAAVLFPRALRLLLALLFLACLLAIGEPIFKRSGYRSAS
jgi:hypothetical protein